MRSRDPYVERQLDREGDSTGIEAEAETKAKSETGIVSGGDLKGDFKKGKNGTGKGKVSRDEANVMPNPIR